MPIKVNDGEVIKFESMSWEEEFDNDYAPLNLGNVYARNHHQSMKAFIQSLLDKQDKEIQVALAEFNDHWNEVLRAEKKELLEKIKLKRPEDYTWNDPYFDGYNQAVSDLEALKKSL
jgi:hypothetical protein